MNTSSFNSLKFGNSNFHSALNPFISLPQSATFNPSPPPPSLSHAFLSLGFCRSMAAAADRTKMATIEKLMVQIFDHKSRILDLVREQTRLFDHHLASKLLLDGIAPPPWLLHPDLPSRTSYVPKGNLAPPPPYNLYMYIHTYIYACI